MRGMFDSEMIKLADNIEKLHEMYLEYDSIVALGYSNAENTQDSIDPKTPTVTD